MKLLTTLLGAVAALALTVGLSTPASACPGHDKAKEQDKTAEKDGAKKDADKATADKDKKKPAKPADDKKKDAPKKDA